ARPANRPRRSASPCGAAQRPSPTSHWSSCRSSLGQAPTLAEPTAPPGGARAPVPELSTGVPPLWGPALSSPEHGLIRVGPEGGISCVPRKEGAIAEAVE